MKTHPLSHPLSHPSSPPHPFSLLFRAQAGASRRAMMAVFCGMSPYLRPGPRRLGLGIALFCLALIALIWAVIPARAERERNLVLQATMRQNANLAIAFEQYTQRIMRNADAVTQFVEIAYLRRNRETNLAQLLAERAAVNDFLEVIAIFDARGQLVASSQPRAPLAVSIADREEFQRQASALAPKLHIGKTAVTPLWDEPAVPITRRIELADGSFGGVVLVLIRPHRFTDFFDDAEVQPGDVFTLAGRDGVVRAKKTRGRQTFGDDLSASAVMAQQARHANGAFRGPGHVDGAMRLFAYRTLKDYPLVAMVGSAETEVLGEYAQRRSLYFAGAAAATACILLFALAVIAALVRVARTADALQESEARFRSLNELSADWWWEQDAEFRFIKIAGMATSHGDLSADEFLGLTRWEVPNLRPVNTTWALHRMVLDARLPFGDLLLERTGADGAVYFEKIAGRPIFDSRGNFLGYRGAGSDITGRIEIERALRDSEARFRHLVELSSDWYWEQDDQFRYTFLSQGHQRNIPVDSAMPLGKAPWELGAQGLTDDQWDGHRRLLDAHRPFRNFEYCGVAADGGQFYISISGDPVFDASGCFTGYRGTGTDITQRKLAEGAILHINTALEERVQRRTEQLEAANHELHAFGYSIAHDMRAPVRAIGGFSQMLLEDHLHEVNVEGKALFSRILTNVEWIGQLIDGLLALSQLSAEPVTRESIDVSQLSQAIIDDLRRLEPDRKVELLLADGLVIDGDRVMVRRMMQNLLGNAWKYSAKRDIARIEVGMLRDANQTPIYFVRDNGEGFDMQYAGKLFQAFQRLHSPAEFPGTGIGLAIVSRIIRKHGGRIRAESAVGKGAAFYFTLWR
ncbi:MAG: ATP-binding protein [Betaproteobacteria bacterium]